MRPGESFINEVLACNRYGSKLCVNVPLWDKFSGNGRFSLRLCAPEFKMSKGQWRRFPPNRGDLNPIETV